MSTPTNPTTANARPALAVAVARELSLPLTALRIAVQGVLDRHDEDGELCDQLDHMLDELARVEHGVEGLIDLVAPPVEHADACTVREIARCAWNSLPTSRRSRVDLALETSRDTCVVDAPQFERALSMLLMEATEDPSAQVLMHAHADASSVNFSVLGGSIETAIDLDGAVARRSLERFGAEVIERETEEHRTNILVRLPLRGAA
tara:strand:+ start:287 stop:904 length:618 start_codon:yes stop_codon:yes gene_type:complete